MTQAEAVKAVPGIVDADLAGKRARLATRMEASRALDAEWTREQAKTR